ncbi:MAG: Phosphoglucomutase/phosphomannomutase alpha/beta/alpha domain I [Parcubacteria group bacterium GW2011_GWC2_39_14]|nr:MAG: Phosphoglucomutase/phosphomannomutase alpha/beta/alpha domain I [Parcubacteria group bacterium GW2011_GWC2_39_14]KKR54816.1 MAG: Phosphoglucomutase/phosphomannomutase alpha/beta/alpha domain I [Parcubacteria group bacterium GW2011_GWA2_40_23]
MPQVNKFMFRGYDLRGIVNEDLTPEIVEHLGRAHGTMMKRAGIAKALIGRDSRATSQEYSEALARGYNQVGVDVIDMGLCLVGVFYWAQYYLKVPGGAFVTASHNPAQYNGFKFAINYSETLVSEGIQKLREMVEAEDYDLSSEPGKIETQDILAAYYSDIVARLPLNKKFKVVIDPSCSTAGVIAPAFFRQAGCEVIESNCKIDPTFPLGTPDPTESIVANRLREEVLKVGADVGFSYDADGDRIGIVDNKGTIIWNDVLVALFAVSVLKEHPGSKIMFNTLCSKVVPETILLNGGVPFMWRTGHSFLKKKNQEVGAAFIGELSGHFFFSKDFYNHDDGLYAALRLLKYLSDSNQTLNEALQKLPQYISSPEIKVFCADDKKVALMDVISEVLRVDFPQAEVISDERAGDGVRLDMPDSMFVIRYSQNGPYLTIKYEAKTQEQYQTLRKYLDELLHRYPEVDWDSANNVNVEALS